MRAQRLCLFVCLVGLLGATAGEAADWPMVQRDVVRSGITAERLAVPLGLRWTFTAPNPPSPAWGDPQPKPVEGNLELPRVRFDDAFHVAAVGEAVYFGSSSDHLVYCLDAAGGAIRWRFATGGPVRLAPTVWKGRLYVGSDDGYVYCLNSADGRLLWKVRGGPTDERVLGHGRVISLWPIRTGVLVADGVAYFGAGLWPSEGVSVFAVSAEDGRLLWRNDTFHRGGQGNVSPQGYLLASAEKLFVPCGRAAPMAFDRRTGRFGYHVRANWRREGLFGGTWATLADGQIYSGTEQVLAYNQETGKYGFAWFRGRRLLVTGKRFYMATGKEVVALSREFPSASRRRQDLAVRRRGLAGDRHNLTREVARLKRRADAETKRRQVQARLDAVEAQLTELITLEQANRRAIQATVRWRSPARCPDAMILAGRTLFGGGDGRVVAIDVDSGKLAWSAPVNGVARGLAVANGRLLVSTDAGAIHCFAPGEAAPATATAEPTAPPLRQATRDLAERIVGEAGVRRGYCLILGGDGKLAAALAERTQLRVYVATADAKTAAEATADLIARRLHGARVGVECVDLARPPYPDYFANLIVCANADGGRSPATPEAELLRMLKPCGGVQIRIKRGGLVKSIRGKLSNTGNWTHQYADAANTTCGADDLVKAPLGVLWFGEPGPTQMPSSHAQSAAPLCVNGRLFVQGENVLFCHDAYNGVHLWTRRIKGALRLGMGGGQSSNLAADADGLFVATANQCRRLDGATGRTVRTYALPAGVDGPMRRWGYVAVADGLLFGSGGGSSEPRQSDSLFARNVRTGEIQWSRPAGNVQHNSIAIGDGRLYCVDRQASDAQRAAAKRQILPGVGGAKREKRDPGLSGDIRVVIALNAKTGRPLWQRPLDVSNCVRVSKGGGELAVLYARGVLLLCGAPQNGHFWREFYEGQFKRRTLIALDAASGVPLWSGRKGYRSRPIIIGETIYAEPWAHELRTGRPVQRVHPVTGAKIHWQMSRPGHHCGTISGSKHMLFFRSGSTAYYDLIRDDGSIHCGAQRPGCWINAIAAGGLLLIPEASSGCVCPFPIMTTVVLRPRRLSRGWGIYSTPGPMTPVKHLAINFGARGDRRDADGVLWLRYPRQKHARLVLQFRLGVDFFAGGKFTEANWETAGIRCPKNPWVLASWARGISRCSLPLLGEGDAARRYTVRLHFVEMENLKPGERVFTVRLQDRAANTPADIVQRTGGPRRSLVIEFKGVRVTKDLVVRFAPTNANSRHKPILSGIEAIVEE